MLVNNIKNKFLFICFTISAIGPIIPYFNIYGGFNVGDVLSFLLLASMIFLGPKLDVSIPVISIVLLFFLSFISLYKNHIFSDFYFSPNYAHLFRWVLYFLIIQVIVFFCNNLYQVDLIFNAILLGLVITILIAWFEWRYFPTYLGGMPMLHVVHNVENFAINRNYLGFFSSILVNMSFVRFMLSDRNIEKLTFFSIFFFSLSTSILTFSKGTWLASVFFLPIFFMLSSNKRLSVFVAIFIFTISILMVFDVAALVDAVFYRIDTSSSTNIHRLQFLKDAVFIFQNHFFWGVGPGGYREAAIFYGLDPTSDPHNALLWLLVEVGILGFLVFVFLIFYSIYILFNLQKNTSLLLVSIFVPLMLNIPFHGLTLSLKYLWFFIALLIVCNKLNQSQLKYKNF